VLLEPDFVPTPPSRNQVLGEQSARSFLGQMELSRQMTDPGESRLVELARAGNQNAFAELYRGCRPLIRAAGCEIFPGPGSESDLEDFCSDVYLLGLRYLSTFRQESRFSTWIAAIAGHRALAIRQRRAQPKNGDSRLVYQGYDTSVEQWENECSAGEDRRMEAAIARSDVARLMGIISPGYRELVQLHHLDGFNETEIAKKTGLSVQAIRSRLSRAMAQLRKKVEKGANRNAPKISLTIQGIILREGESSE
jgi:RNA polymerase sigma-70 factor, ECF subfamily